jgi:ligand-binding SRPBCC domain-containing protein
MTVHTLMTSQDLPIGKSAAWRFLSNPKNLKEITPDYMGFEILNSVLPEKIYPGLIISYQVTPIAGINMNWLTEITHVIEGEYFVDEQRIGPYAFWHHQHFIKEIEGGVRIEDIVHYKAPLGFFGSLVTPVLVKPKLKEIFDYRFHKLQELFGKY